MKTTIKQDEVKVFNPITVTITLETESEAAQFTALIGSGAVVPLTAIKSSLYVLFDKLVHQVPVVKDTNNFFWDAIRASNH